MTVRIRSTTTGLRSRTLRLNIYPVLQSRSSAAMWSWAFYADDPLNSKTADEIIEEVDYNSNIINLKMKFRYPGYYQLGINNQYFKTKFKATKGDWVGGRLGLFARGYTNNYALFKYFKVRGLDAK